MPVVFVHGVATRRSPAYERSSAQRSALLRSFLAPALRVPTDALTVLDAYWGDAASTFAWGHASLPDGGEERFGTAAPEESPVLASACAAHPETAAHAPLTAVARTCLADAIDLLWTASSERALAAEAVELAELAVAAASYADRHADPSWLAAVTAARVRRLGEDLVAQPADESRDVLYDLLRVWLHRTQAWLRASYENDGVGRDRVANRVAAEQGSPDSQAPR
ncbi:hypothetical protein ACWGR4_39315 [Embleya sp. NPDC055664]